MQLRRFGKAGSRSEDGWMLCAATIVIVGLLLAVALPALTLDLPEAKWKRFSVINGLIGPLVIGSAFFLLASAAQFPHASLVAVLTAIIHIITRLRR